MTEDDFRAMSRHSTPTISKASAASTPTTWCSSWARRKRIVGRENILAFYREVKARITEVVTPIEVIVTPTRIAMYCHTSFDTFEDWPDFEIWPTKAGDHREVETIAMYEVDGDRFTHIRGARFKPRGTWRRNSPLPPRARCAPPRQARRSSSARGSPARPTLRRFRTSAHRRQGLAKSPASPCEVGGLLVVQGDSCRIR